MRNRIIFTLFGLLILVGCNRKIDVVNPIIITNPSEPAPFDTVKTSLLGELELHGEPATIDSYTWEVTDGNGNIVPILSASDGTMNWIPVAEGGHTISVILESGNKSIKQMKQVQVNHSVQSVQRKMVGSWNATCTPTYSGYWEATVSFAADGHYTAHVTSGSATAFLDNGLDDVDFPERKMILDQMNDLDSASGTIKFMHYGGSIMTYPFCELIISEDYNTLDFWVGWNGYPKMVAYHLTRQ